jgi:hypothetical protein
MSWKIWVIVLILVASEPMVELLAQLTGWIVGYLF